MHHEHLRTRRVLNREEEILTDVPKLFSHNADVDRINATELAKLKGVARKFYMSSKGKDSLVEGLKRGCLSPKVLELKEGAAVMFRELAAREIRQRYARAGEWLGRRRPANC